MKAKQSAYNRVMVILVTVGILIETLLLAVIGSVLFFEMTGAKVDMHFSLVKYINEYDEYIFYKRKRVEKEFFNFDFFEVSPDSYRIWVSPRQKEALQEAIRNDVKNSMDALIAEDNSNSNIIESYKINDDFTQVTLYCHEENRYKILDMWDSDEVRTKMKLYHAVSNSADAYDWNTCISIKSYPSNAYLETP